MKKVNIVLSKYLRENISDNEGTYKAATNIKELLAQMDMSAEVVPENNLDMLFRLVTSLKNEELTADEHRIIEEIIEL